MKEEDILYRAWRASEAYGVPTTPKAEEQLKQRWYGFKTGWEAHKALQEKINECL